jgi:hypothetical protein
MGNIRCGAPFFTSTVVTAGCIGGPVAEVTDGLEASTTTVRMLVATTGCVLLEGGCIDSIDVIMVALVPLTGLELANVVFPTDEVLALADVKVGVESDCRDEVDEETKEMEMVIVSKGRVSSSVPVDSVRRGPTYREMTEGRSLRTFDCSVSETSIDQRIAEETLKILGVGVGRI